MSPSATALTIILGIVALGTALGFYAGARRRMDLEQWTVAGRGFGVLLMWLLMAGEVYTTFSFLGASGWAFSRGAPTLYILAYLTLSYVVSFFILPPVWELGRQHKLQTQSDFFAWRYRSKYLVSAVSLVGIVFMIPYLELQITGFGIIVEVASYDAIHRNPAMIAAVALLAGFVLTGGLRAVAWVSVLKDLLMLIAALAVGIGVPYARFGGIGPMFTALIHAKPTHFVMPGATTNLGHSWYISTVLLTGFGVYMWPHSFGAAFSAKSATTLRRNAVIMPLYTLSLAFMLFVGFAAILVMPELRDGDLSLLAMVRKIFPPWVLGVVGGAGALTAMVPAAILLLSSATVFSKNLF
ncbi:MAG TPA: sodium:solute symporter family protein, partial [Bryobacteraceae bacterium]|nr:sodium:solute symporter family protein [Bryobacteraceae bacterium]